MHPMDPLTELRSLRALANAIQASVQRELDRLGRSGTSTPAERACLARARGHLELAQRALSEANPEQPPWARVVPSKLKLGGPEYRGRGKRTQAPGPAARSKPAQRPVVEAAPGDRSPIPGGRDTDGLDTAAMGDAPTWAQRRVEEIGRALDSALLEGVLDDTKGATRSEDGSEAHSQHAGAPTAVAQSVGVDGLAPGSRPHFSGHTDVLSIPDLVGFFQMQSKTGVLEIQHASEVFRFEFENGTLLHAASSRSPAGERLGEILVRRGALTEASLPQLLAQLASGERLGDALLRLDGITQADLTGAVEEQVLGIFVRLAKLPGCSFTFHECTFDRDLPGRVRHNVTRLLLDSARYLDDEAHARRESA
jgi:hypothetical protein